MERDEPTVEQETDKDQLKKQEDALLQQARSANSNTLDLQIMPQLIDIYKRRTGATTVSQEELEKIRRKIKDQ